MLYTITTKFRHHYLTKRMGKTDTSPGGNKSTQHRLRLQSKLTMSWDTDLDFMFCLLMPSSSTLCLSLAAVAIMETESCGCVGITRVKTYIWQRAVIVGELPLSCSHPFLPPLLPAFLPTEFSSSHCIFT